MHYAYNTLAPHFALLWPVPLDIDPQVMAALQRGEKPEIPDAGITVFKLGFNGVVSALPPTLIWFPNPVIRLLFKGIGLPLLRNTRIRNILLKRK